MAGLLPLPHRLRDNMINDAPNVSSAPPECPRKRCGAEGAWAKTNESGKHRDERAVKRNGPLRHNKLLAHCVAMNVPPSLTNAPPAVIFAPP